MSSAQLTAAVGDWTIDTRWAAYGADSKQIGTVRGVLLDYLVVQTGRFFRRERFIPISIITCVEHQCVYLNVSSTEIDNRGWDALPDRSGSITALGHHGEVVRPVTAR